RSVCLSRARRVFSVSPMTIGRVRSDMGLTSLSLAAPTIPPESLVAPMKGGRVAEVDPLGSLPSWLLSRAGVRAHRILQRRFDAIGFTGYESRVLAALNAAGPQSQAQIGRAVSLDRRDVTYTVR